MHNKKQAYQMYITFDTVLSTFTTSLQVRSQSRLASRIESESASYLL